MSHTILVIDDDEAFTGVMLRALKRRGHVAHAVHDSAMAADAAQRFSPDWIVLDLNLAGVSGLSLLGPLQEASPESAIVMLTGYASIATAVDAIKLGAVQYLAKPVDIDELLACFENSNTVNFDAPIEATPLSVPRLEWEHIQRVLHEHGGNISATARALKMHRRTLQRKLMKHPAAE